MEHLDFLLFIPSTTYPHTCTSRSWLYDLFTLWVRSLTLQNIWDKYALVFLPTLSSTKKPLEVGERRRTKGLGEDTNTFERMRVSFEELFFIFQKLLKTSGRNLEQGMGKWCSMKRSISQPPKTRRSPKSPMEIKVKRVSKVWPTYSVWDRMCSCNLCMMKRWSIAATPDQQPKV